MSYCDRGGNLVLVLFAKLRLIALAIFCLLCGGVAVSAPADNAETVSGWTVSGRNGACSMLRPYNKAVNTWIVLGRNLNGRQFIRVHDLRWKVVKGQDYAATLKLDGVETLLPANGAITDGVNRTSGFTSTTNIDWQSKMAIATQMSVMIPQNVEAVIDLAGAAAALTAMNQCVQRALANGEVSLSSPPRIAVALKLSEKDYADFPTTDVVGKTVAIRLVVDSVGKPKRCDIMTSSGTTNVDNRACKLATDRMLFFPAIASDGRPVEATFQFRIGL